MELIVAVSALAALAFASLRYGTDSRVERA